MNHSSIGTSPCHRPTLTDTGVDDVSADGPFEEAGAPVAADGAVVAAERAVPTDGTGHRAGQAATWGRAGHTGAVLTYLPGAVLFHKTAQNRIKA